MLGLETLSERRWITLQITWNASLEEKTLFDNANSRLQETANISTESNQTIKRLLVYIGSGFDHKFPITCLSNQASAKYRIVLCIRDTVPETIDSGPDFKISL